MAPANRLRGWKAGHAKWRSLHSEARDCFPLGRDNSGINLALRAPGDVRPGWKERLGIGPRTSYSFTLAARDEAGAQLVSAVISRGANRVANAAAQSVDPSRSYCPIRRAELGCC